MRRALFVLLLVLVAACSKASARGRSAIRIEGAIARVMPGGAGAVYLRVVNDGLEGDRLESVECPDARDAQLHETVREGDLTSMRHAENGFPVVARGSLALEHGGRHVMVFGVADPTHARSLRLRLHFQHAGVVEMVAPIEGAIQPARRQLRVCADPNNLPFSNRRGEGFENELARLVASELDADVTYAWFPQRRGFFRQTLKANKCDVVMGVPARSDMIATTKPYYRSSYVFVYGPRTKHVGSLDARELRDMRIGVPLVGDDGANPPPVLALAPRNLVANVRGYSVYGDITKESPPGDVIRAVRSGEVDLAIAWGPSAGWFARAAEPPLAVERIPESEAPPGLTFEFDIAMGVRRADRALAAELNAVIDRRAKDIAAVLDRHHVPRL
jgi:mxaJ protein